MGNLLGWFVLLGIGVPFSIALHELGHLLPAKRFGVACPQYFIGFGPKVWSIRRGGTEYGIKAIPLGGYVRMIGMFPPAPDRAKGGAGRLASLIDAARADAAREIGPDDAGKLFYQRTVPQRLTIMLGGPTMNLILAVVLLGGIYTLYGLPQLTSTVRTVSKCVIPVSTDANATPRDCTASDPAAPAAKAGLLPGDRIVRFGGAPVTDWDDVRGRIRANRGTPVEIVVVRGGAEATLTATPMVDMRYALDADGNPLKNADGTYRTEQVGFLGVAPAQAMVRQSPGAVPGIIGGNLKQTAAVVLQVPEKLVSLGRTLLGQQERDPNGLVSVVGVGRLAGEVGAMEGTAETPIGWGDRIAAWVSIIASLNLALFVFNLIPLLPLDGGHVIGALWEALRRGVNRSLGRPDPGPVDIARALPLAYAVGSVLVAMSALLIYADIVKPIRLGG